VCAMMGKLALQQTHAQVSVYMCHGRHTLQQVRVVVGFRMPQSNLPMCSVCAVHVLQGQTAYPAMHVSLPSMHGDKRFLTTCSHLASQIVLSASLPAERRGSEPSLGAAGAAQLSASRPGAGTTAPQQRPGSSSGSLRGKSPAGAAMRAQSQHPGAGTTALVALQLAGGSLSQRGAGLLPGPLAAAAGPAAPEPALAPAPALAAVAGLEAPPTLVTHAGGVVVVVAGHAGSGLLSY
jgi:hypothetical protein